MCGRAYSTYSEEELRFRYLNRKPWPWKIHQEIPGIRPNYNICPTHVVLVLSVDENQLSFRPMRWGLVPAWAKTIKDADKYSMINAKAEEIAEKRSYKMAFRKRRCVVPFSGFYEWHRSGEVKTPFAIHLKHEPIISIAGVWEHWTSEESGEVVDSFSIITMPANSFMESIHTRMPLILRQEDEESWLDPKEENPANLSPLMRGCDSEEMTAFEVSKRVNSPKNNSKENLEPVVN